MKDSRSGPQAGRLGKAGAVHQRIRTEILVGERIAGEQLLEQSLAGEFGVSQSTIREALQKLAEDGLVERRGYRGTVITATGVSEAAEMVGIRLRIERVAARGMFRRRFDPAPFIDVTHAMEQAWDSGDVAEYAWCDRWFHAGLVKTAGFPILAPILERCMLHIHRFMLTRPLSRRDGGALGLDHRKIVEAVANGDGDHAERAVVDHVVGSLLRSSVELHAACDPAIFRTDAGPAGGS